MSEKERLRAELLSTLQVQPHNVPVIDFLKEEIAKLEKREEIGKLEREKEALEAKFREASDEGKTALMDLYRAQINDVCKALYSSLGTRTDFSMLKETLVEGFSEMRQLITAGKALEGSKGFSNVGSEEAGRMILELDVVEVDGNLMYPIDVPEDASQCDEFDYSQYPSEDDGTPNFLEHHKAQLTKLGVFFGKGGFQVFDLHKQNAFSLLTSTGKLFKGSVDGAIAPYGLRTATSQMRICYEHKQTEGQRTEYKNRHPEIFKEKMSDASAESLQFRGSARGQAVTELLAAYSVNRFPLLLDLTDGKIHHLLSLTANELVVWQNLTPRQAYSKQAQLLLSSDHASNRLLRLEDIPENESAPLKKMRKWRPENGLLEQLSCLEDLPADARVETALELFQSWSHITPPVMPIPEAVLHFYA